MTDNTQLPPSNAQIPSQTKDIPPKKRLKLIACEILSRELCLAAAQSDNIVDVAFLRKGLHDAGKDVMRQALQETINQVQTSDYDAILLGYARCNDGVVGLKAPEIPLVIPRAHDCITLFFGSRKAYENYFNSQPGTYFRTSGWTERDTPGQDSIMTQLGLNRTYDEYVAKYGKENADFIIQSLGAWQDNYTHIAYIDMGLPIDKIYAQHAKQEAAQHKLDFDQITGNLTLIQKLLNGPWNPQDFLLVPPHAKITANDDGQILCHS